MATPLAKSNQWSCALLWFESKMTSHAHVTELVVSGWWWSLCDSYETDPRYRNWVIGRQVLGTLELGCVFGWLSLYFLTASTIQPALSCSLCHRWGVLYPNACLVMIISTLSNHEPKEILPLWICSLRVVCQSYGKVMNTSLQTQRFHSPHRNSHSLPQKSHPCPRSIV